VIYVRPLTYTTDASDINRYEELIVVPFATPDLSLVGASNTNPGNPNYGAKLQYISGSGYAITVNAPAFHLENMCVRSEGSTGGGIHFRGVGAATTPEYGTYAGSCGSTMYHCVMRGGKYAVRVTGGYATQIVDCRFEGGSGQYSSLVLDGNTDPQRRVAVKDCHFDSYNGAAIAEAYIRIYSNTDLLVKDCTFDILPTDTHFINATGTNLGLLSNLHFGIANMTLATAIIKGGLFASLLWDETGIVLA